MSDEELKENVISTCHTSDLHSDFFKKSHQLVFSQLALSPIEHDIMALFLTRLAKEHWEEYLRGEYRIETVPRYEFTSDVLSEWFNIEKSYLFSTLLKPSDRLSSQKIGIRSETNKSFTFIPLFKRIHYKGGVLTVVPNDELLQEYLCLSQGHSQIPHKQFRSIPLEHGKRLFSMLCRFRYGGTLHAQTISDLHGFFGLCNQNGKLIKTTYSNTSVFISRIIKTAIASIDQNVPEIEFHLDNKTGNLGYSYVKKGRTIVAINFLFSWADKVNMDLQKVELTLDDAKRTHTEIISHSSVPSSYEVDNLKKHMATMLLSGFSFGDEFVVNLTEVERINSENSVA